MKHLAFAAALLALPVAAFAADAPEKAAVCAACHGEAGRSTIPANPVLAGQYANYLENALTEYKTGLRKNPIMAAQAAALSKDDIKTLARYFAAQQSPLHTPSVHHASR